MKFAKLQINRTQKVTAEAKLLYGALKRRKIYCQMEFWDGYKHVDIAIPWAKIDIEVDGIQHYIDSKQILSDFLREHFSDNNDKFYTIHIPNALIKDHLNDIADALAKTARRQYRNLQLYQRNKNFKYV